MEMNDDLKVHHKQWKMSFKRVMKIGIMRRDLKYSE